MLNTAHWKTSSGCLKFASLSLLLYNLYLIRRPFIYKRKVTACKGCIRPGHFIQVVGLFIPMAVRNRECVIPDVFLNYFFTLML